MYREAVVLEAERQKAVYGYLEDWADEFSQLIEDDAVATVLQVMLLLKAMIPVACTTKLFFFR